jgi:hypothetical protein
MASTEDTMLADEEEVCPQVTEVRAIALRKAFAELLGTFLLVFTTWCCAPPFPRKIKWMICRGGRQRNMRVMESHFLLGVPTRPPVCARPFVVRKRNRPESACLISWRTPAR